MSEEATWWSDDGVNASKRLLRESKAMERFFQVGQAITVLLPPSTWDTDSYKLYPHRLEITSDVDGIRADKHSPYLHGSDGPLYDLGWTILFSMSDRKRLCFKEETWDMRVLYPLSYPQADPDVIVMNLEKKTSPEIAVLNARRHIVVKGKQHIVFCLFGNQDPLYHQLLRTSWLAVDYAKRGILQLRARIHAHKKQREPSALYPPTLEEYGTTHE